MKESKWTLDCLVQMLQHLKITVRIGSGVYGLKVPTKKKEFNDEFLDALFASKIYCLELSRARLLGFSSNQFLVAMYLTTATMHTALVKIPLPLATVSNALQSCMEYRNHFSQYYKSHKKPKSGFYF